MEQEPKKKVAGAGGTPGGVGMFLLGFVLAGAGAWLLTNQVIVSSDYFTAGFFMPMVNFRVNSFGLSLLPFLIGIAMLFFNAKSLLGWIFTCTGLAILFAGILMTLHIHFQPTTLFNTLVMLVLLFGGLGLILRSFKAMPEVEAEGAKPGNEPG